jgi:hypothetical protein
LQQSVNGLHDFVAAILGDSTLKASFARHYCQLTRHILNSDPKHRKARFDFGYYAGGVDAIHNRHPQIEYHKIECDVRNLVNSIRTVFCFGAHSPPWSRLQKSSKQSANHWIIIRNQYSEEHLTLPIFRLRAMIR